MSEHWAARERRTNRLARHLAGHLLARGKPTAQQIYGLSKLAWITRSDEGEAASYIRRTKIPALGDALGEDFSSKSLEQVANKVAETLDDSSVKDLVLSHSGFTNFYNAYRKSVFSWIEDNHSKLLPMYKLAFYSKSQNTRLKLIKAITELPDIPKANHPDQLMKPEYFLTPVFFMLDPEIRFPIINRNKGVQNLLKASKVVGSDLVSQYKALVKLYGTGGIKDAADLDQVGHYMA